MEEKATSKRYPPELKERAVRMIKELRQQDPGDKAVTLRVARQLGVGCGPGSSSARSTLARGRDSRRPSRPSSKSFAKRSGSCAALSAATNMGPLDG
jgi:transposase-like protein